MMHRVCGMIALGALALAPWTASAQRGRGGGEQQGAESPPPAPSYPSSRGGLLGQRVKLPNVLGRNRSLPLERHITLPGLPSQPPCEVEPVAPVGPWPRGVTGSGLVVNGDYDGEKLDLHLHLGSGVTWIDDGRVYSPGLRHTRGYYVRNGRVCYDPGWYYYRPWYYDNRPVDGVLTQRVDTTLLGQQLAQPQPAPAEPAPELTALEKAELFMAADDLERAVRYYREHLDADPEDAGAMRAMGVAMVEDGRLEDGIAMIALAYRTDPQLGRTALDLGALGLDGRRYDSLLSRVLNFARKVDSASSHLAGAMLLQADGKVAGASRVLERADRSGLSEEVLDPMRRELGVPAARG